MTTTPDIEAVTEPLQDRLRRIFDDARGSDTLIDLLAEFDLEGSGDLAELIVIGMGGSGTILELTDEITDLQARVVAAEAEVLEQARLVGMGSEREARLMAQLTASQAEVARGEQALADAISVAAEAVECAEALRADLAAHKAAVAAVAEAYRRCTEPDPLGRNYWLSEVAEPLRAFAEPAKQPEGDALVEALERIAEAAEKGWQGSGGLGRMARKALAARGLSVGAGK